MKRPYFGHSGYSSGAKMHTVINRNKFLYPIDTRWIGCSNQDMTDIFKVGVSGFNGYLILIDINMTIHLC